MTDANVLLKWLRYERIDGVPDEERRRQCADIIERQAAELEQCRKDAARYRWLRSRTACADFDYGYSHATVLAFDWPRDARISGDIDWSIDLASSQDRSSQPAALRESQP